jgi:hypothetical protein
LEKAAQKLLFELGLWRCNRTSPVQESFFASFCSQKEAFLHFLHASGSTGEIIREET